MQIRPSKRIVGESDPFADDRLGRRESVGRLTYLLERADTPFVFAIDANYGNGKTTFIQMWRAHLKVNGFHSLYFNAWEADFTSDPLIAFIGEMDAEIARILGDKNGPIKKLRKAWEKVKQGGAYLVKRAIPVGVRVGTAGALDLDSFTEQSLAKLAEQVAKEQIEKYEAIKNRIKEFKERLGDFIEELNSLNQGPLRPLVFFIDEMDRCRPTYAIELLERIKHFFDVEGIIFVLAMDKTQLGHSIRSVYGAGIDVDGYLRRFIDLEYRFPTLKTEKFMALLVSQFKLADILQKTQQSDVVGSLSTGVSTFQGLAESFCLSLRVQEQCFARLAVILMTAERGKLHLPLVMGLLCLQAADSALYTGFVNEEKKVEEVLSFISRTTRGRGFLEESEGTLFEIFLLKSRMKTDPSVGKLLDAYKVATSASDNTTPRTIRASSILERVALRTFNFDNYDMVKEAAQAIDFSSRFAPPAPPGNLVVS